MFKDCILDTLKILCVFFWLLLFLVLFSIAIENQSKKMSIEQYCVVVDKDISTVLVGKVATMQHYLYVRVSDSEELNDKILVSSSFYDSVEVGTEIKCVVYYNSENVVDIELADN